MFELNKNCSLESLLKTEREVSYILNYVLEHFERIQLLTTNMGAEKCFFLHKMSNTFPQYF